MAGRQFLGNFWGLWEELESLNPHPGKRRLVEECEAVWVYAVQRAFGKKALISAIRQACPFRLPVPGGYFDIWLVDEPHRLPGRRERWSSLEAGTARLWLVCPGCRQKVAKLYYYLAPGSSARSHLLCRRCHNLTYQSMNCGGNRWYREIARPMKRLLRAKHKLMARQHEPRIAARLAQIEDQIRLLRQKAKRKTHRQRLGSTYRLAVRERRPYRNLALLDQYATVPESTYSATVQDRSGPSDAGRKNNKSRISQPKRTLEQMWEEYRQSWLEEISRQRAEGLITDEHLRRVPRLRRAIAALAREQKRTPNS